MTNAVAPWNFICYFVKGQLSSKCQVFKWINYSVRGLHGLSHGHVSPSGVSDLSVPGSGQVTKMRGHVPQAPGSMDIMVVGRQDDA